MSIAYLDNSATTKPCDAAIAAANEMMQTCWANPSSQYALGNDAAHKLSQARAQVAQAMGAQSERVFFTSGGTEADNWAISGAVARLAKRGKHIITTAVEHHAVLHPMQKLALQGFEVTYLQPDEQGSVTLDALREALRPDTILVSIMMVNNESGAVMPISEMAKLTHRRSPNALFHTDAVQGFFKTPFQAKTLGADLITVSAHKIHALKGAGALYIRPNLPLPALLNGGGQEGNFRSGTEAMPAICAFGAACAAQLPTAKDDIAKMITLRDDCRALLAEIPEVVCFGANEAPHIVGASIPGLRSQGIINCLQDEKVYVSAGSACAQGRRSHVLEAMNLPNQVIDGAIRISLCAENTADDILRLRNGLLHAIQTLKG